MMNTNEKPSLNWETINSSSGLDMRLQRACVPGGWLLWGVVEQSTICFYPDPEHIWDGGSLNDYSERSLMRQWMKAWPHWQKANKQLSDSQHAIDAKLRELPALTERGQDRHYRQAALSLKELREQFVEIKQRLDAIEKELEDLWKK